MVSTEMPRNSSSARGTSQPQVSTQALDIKSVKSILLPSGWQQVSNCQLTQFAVGEAHSPIVPSKLYPYLQFEDQQGRQAFVAVNSILGYSSEVVTGR